MEEEIKQAEMRSLVLALPITRLANVENLAFSEKDLLDSRRSFGRVEEGKTENERDRRD